MEYKPIWPTSGRDFCNLVLLRELHEGVYGLASEAVCIPLRSSSTPTAVYARFFFRGGGGGGEEGAHYDKYPANL